MTRPLLPGRQRRPSGASAAADVPAVALASVGKVFGRGSGAVRALSEVTVSFAAGSFTAVMGPSGSGKTTLLQCASGLDRPSSGSVRLGGVELTSLGENELTRLRRARIGFVFQSFNLLPSLSAAQNVLLPLRLAGRRPPGRLAREVLATVGLPELGRRRPGELSGGQQQRVAIARALVTAPDVIFADEPTGALDSESAAGVLRLLREIVDERGATVVMVTHDPQAASHADEVVFLADGRLAGAVGAADAAGIAERLVELTARTGRRERAR